jgi:ribosomal-protein-alanine N-acetyltransferase
VIWWPESIPTLKVATTTLRPVVPADAEDIYKAMQDPEIPKFTTLPADYPLDLAIDLAANKAIACHANKSQLYFAIEDSRLNSTSSSPDPNKSTDPNISRSEKISYPFSNGFAGVISLHSIDLPNHRAEIGYWLAKEARGMRVGTNAAVAITEYGLMTMGFNRIDGIVNVANEPSKKMLLNAGYEYEGIMKKYATRPDGTQIDMALFAATK